MGLDIVEADAGGKYDFSQSTFSNKLFPSAKTPSYDMRVFVQQWGSAPETVEKSVCWTVTAGVAASAGVKSDKVEALSASAEAGADVSMQDCSSWTDVPGGYNVYLSVFDQTDPNFDVAYGLVPEFGAKLPTGKAAPATNHPASARVVCINRITTLALDSAEAGYEVEVGINLSSSKSSTGDRQDNIWPRVASDCKFGFNAGPPDSCNIGYDGGAQSVNNLCASLWDDSYDLDVTITEVDSMWSANDISSLSIAPSDWPQFRKDGVTRYTMKKFVKEDAAEKAVDHDGCITIDLSVAAEIGLTEGPVTSGVAFSTGFTLEDCSKWTEVPGGYTIHMSVYTEADPNYDVAYSLTGPWLKE